MAMRKLHGVGVSHNDIKGDNFLFRTKDAKGWSVSNLESRGLNDWCISLDQESHDCSFSGFDAQESHDLSFSSLESQESHDWSVSSLCADEGQDDKDWCILDFGQAVFRLDCSSAEWEERCRKEMSDLDKIFRETRAQLVSSKIVKFELYTDIARPLTHCINMYMIGPVGRVGVPKMLVLLMTAFPSISTIASPKTSTTASPPLPTASIKTSSSPSSKQPQPSPQ